MIAANETFDGTWPYAPHFFAGNGFKHHYVDEGPHAPDSNGGGRGGRRWNPARR